MKNCLLLLAVAAALVVGGPAYSQYVFLDVNGDGLNSNLNALLPDDVLTPGTYDIDVYFVTDSTSAGSFVVCPQDPSKPLSMFSYDVTLHTSGSGTVTYNSWTDMMGFSTNFTPICPGDFCPTSPTTSTDIWLGRGGNPASPLVGKFKIGHLNITVSGSPKIDFASSSSINGSAQTAFGSACQGNQADQTIRLGDDFNEAYGTEAPTPVVPTTWGKIKALYH